MASLDDIWDTPAEASSSRSKSPSVAADPDEHGGRSPLPAKRPASSRPLFLHSDSENEAQGSSKSRYASKPASNKPDIDAFFADLDDDPDTAFQDLAPSLDVAALKRQAEARLALTPHQILPSSSPPRDLSDGEEGGARKRAGDRKGRDEPVKKKKPKRRPPLDEARLVSPDGFPALAKQAKEFKPKGKGHEVQDLGRLLNVYQFWAHNLYANTHFTDTVQKVEKLCHSKRMNVALSVWRDEAKGLINGHKIPGPDDPLDSSDSDNDGANEHASRPRATTQEPAHDVPIATDAERPGSSPARRSTHEASLPPSSPASSLGALNDDFDIDAMIREDEAVRMQGPPAPGPAPQATYGVPRGGPGAAEDEDEDAAMWDAVMDDLPDEPYVPPARQPSGPSASGGGGGGGGMDEDMDEDMWDMVREMEAEPTVTTAAPAAPAPSASAAVAEAVEGQSQTGSSMPEEQGEPSKATNDEGWDEMYA
ncbi:Chromosome segregation in meiosis protein 3 [Trametes pubescens]|uniref:Chromosome segregation in meiosis protein n=1 Tax=Trametes pubescens TaxID=154538 RepID=A0A1M2V9V7_TRAPU|nr:Chromosome segregation in meiosis protein 3 [Trametes pubescens]